MIYGATQAEVQKQLTQALAKLEIEEYVKPVNITVGAWLDEWLENYAAVTVKPSTHHAYKKSVESYLKPYLAALKLKTLKTQDIQKMIKALHDGVSDRKPLSPKTVKNAHGVLHKALQQAADLDPPLIHSNPATKCVLPQRIQREMAVLDRKDIAVFLDAIRGHQYESLFFITLFTGMRQSEAIGLRWRCVDFENGTITINAQLRRDYANRTYVLDETTKSKKPRRITPATAVMDKLREQKAQQAEWQAAAGDAWQESAWVFTNELGEPLRHPTVQGNFKRLVRELGMGDTRFHDLRHTYMVAALQAGDDPKSVQDALGHATAAFTLDVYGHITGQMRKESSERMDKFISNLAQGG
jgi:integrase